MRSVHHHRTAAVAITAAFLSGGAAVAQPLAMTDPGPFPASVFQQIERDPVPAPQNSPQPGATDNEADIVPAHLRRQVLAYDTREAPGTIVIDTPNTYLYYVLGQGRAIRYGIGVGREGFTWSGVKAIDRKQEWPDWHPPAEMIARQPYLPRYMAGGPGNPLGARAMYLGGTLYRIHGTSEPSSIGKHVSSGCIRMLNEDAIDLYNRAPIGTKVVVLPDDPRRRAPAAVARTQRIDSVRAQTTQAASAARPRAAAIERPRASEPSRAVEYRDDFPRPPARTPETTASSLYFGSSASRLY
jgi:lipoprotein-anchoring transpeptidase ErfK/SrfK